MANNFLVYKNFKIGTLIEENTKDIVDKIYNKADKVIENNYSRRLQLGPALKVIEKIKTQNKLKKTKLFQILVQILQRKLKK